MSEKLNGFPLVLGVLMATVFAAGKPGSLCLSPALASNRQVRSDDSPLPSPQDLAWIKRQVRTGRDFEGALDLSELRLSPDAIREIATVAHIDMLSLRRCGVTDKDVIQLETLSRLKYLDLSENQITDSAASSLSKLPNLEVLLLDSTRISDETIETVAAKGHLVTFSASHTQVRGEGLICLSQCRNLYRLTLRRNALDSKRWRGISTLTRLRHLDISGSSLVAADLDALRPLVNLRSLDVSFIRDVRDEDMPKIAGLPFLEMLNLRASRVTDTGVRTLTGLRLLRTLDVSRTKVTNGIITIVEKAPQLLSVSISRDILDAEQLQMSAARKRIELVLEELPPDLELLPEEDQTEPAGI